MNEDSAHSSSDQPRSIHQCDTLTVFYTSKDNSALHKPSESVDLTLIKEQFEDSLLTFQYWNNNQLKMSYRFSIAHNSFDLIQTLPEGDPLMVVDTFSLNFNKRQLTVYKMERVMPPMDGGMCILITKEYGVIATSSYTWKTKISLTKWGSETFSAIEIQDSSIFKPSRHGSSVEIEETEIITVDSFTNF